MLYIVATPIGNLNDLSARAQDILKRVDMIICEDTRVTSKLLAAYHIQKTLKTFHQHSTGIQLNALIHEITNGKQAAYVSDAGTPGVNDPGGKLAAAAHIAGIPVVPIPGPSALTAAISACGFPMEHFVYLGFAPTKKGRQTFFNELANRDEAVIFFESTHRLLKSLEALRDVLSCDVLTSGRLVCVCREMTKMHETIYRGTSGAVLEAVKSSSTKGESVIIAAPKQYRDST